MMIYTVYRLQSNFTGKYYTGQTQDLEKSTKHGTPLKLIYSSECYSRSEAMILEKRIKKRGAKRFLEKLN